MIDKQTGYWFSKIHTARLLEALKGKNFMGAAMSYTVHDDGDKSMLEAHFHMNLEPAVLDTAHKMLCMFIMGFEAAHNTAMMVLPHYRVGSEGRSGNRLDQANRTWPHGGTPRNHHSVVSLPSSASRGDAEAARNAAYDGIQQFCYLNGLTYPEGDHGNNE